MQLNNDAASRLYEAEKAARAGNNVFGLKALGRFQYSMFFTTREGAQEFWDAFKANNASSYDGIEEVTPDRLHKILKSVDGIGLIGHQ